MRRFHWTKVTAAVVALLVLTVVLLFSLVHANTFRPLLEAQLTETLGRQVKLGNLRFAPFSGSLMADNLSIAGDPNYSPEPFLTAKQLRIGVEIKPLLFTRQLQVRSLEIDQPQIHLVRGADGSWNFSTIGNAASRKGSPIATSVFPNLVVGWLAIRDGKATVENFPVPGPARVYDDVNLTARGVSFVQRIPFQLSASLPGNGKVSLTGTAGPVNAQDAATTAVDAQVSIRHLEPVTAGFLDADVGVSVLADVEAHVRSDGQVVRSSGTIRMDHLQLGKAGAPSPEPIDLSYDVTHNLGDKSGQINSADILIGNVEIQMGGVYRLVPDHPWLNVKVSGEGLPIDDLQALMTAAGVRLPNGSVLRGGTLTVALTATGPAENLVVTGPIAVQNTRLVGFDLGSKIAGIAALGGVKTGDTTEIQTLRCNLQASNAGLQIDNIDSVLPALGEAVGSGTVSSAGALNFHLVAKVTSASGLGKVGVGLLAKLNGRGGTKGQANSIRGVPVLVTGTANDPVITADVHGLMHRALKRLFNRKK